METKYNGLCNSTVDFLIKFEDKSIHKSHLSRKLYLVVNYWLDSKRCYDGGTVHSAIMTSRDILERAINVPRAEGEYWKDHYIRVI